MVYAAVSSAARIGNAFEFIVFRHLFFIINLNKDFLEVDKFLNFLVVQREGMDDGA